ncbi:MAG: DNA polymerase III subunit delta' [Reinekea sp.]|jgi:DNA polymerase III subunit delta'
MRDNLPAWLLESFSSLVEVAKADRLPHGLLLVGRSGDGASLLSQVLIDYLLCLKPGDQACGQCKSCQLNRSGSHPDYLRIEPDGKSMTIKIDAVRQITHKLSETAQQGGSKVIYLQSAEKMNVNAANALLKVLEEPTPNTFILLEASELSRTLPTIRSRCRLVQLPRPTIEQARQYLDFQGFQGNSEVALSMTFTAPIDVLKLTDDQINAWQEIERTFADPKSFIAFSQFIAKQDLPILFQQLLLWVDTTIKEKNGQISLAPVSDRLLQSLKAMSAITLFRFRDYIVGILSAFQRHANLNQQLLAEELAARWIELRGYK